MTTRYINSGSSGGQYYINTNCSTTSQSYRNYSSPVTTTRAYGSSNYSTYPAGISSAHSPRQQIRLDGNIYHQDDPYQLLPRYQSVAGFDKNRTQQQQQHYQLPVHQGRATIRSVNSQDQYPSQRSTQPMQITPQHHHFQFDSRQQSDRSTGPAVVYQTPGAAKYTHRNVDIWTENPSQGHDHHIQAPRVSVQSVSTVFPQQSHSISPQRRDNLQQYYNQLTPEQHQQLLRQQRIQRQQEDNSYYKQEHQAAAVAAPQQSSSSANYHQGQHRSPASIVGEQHYQQVSPTQRQRSRSEAERQRDRSEAERQRGRSEAERQRQDEQDYYAAQRLMAAQRMQQEQEESGHPVGIQDLVSKFSGPVPVQTYTLKSKSTSPRHHLSNISRSGSSPTQKTQAPIMPLMTYSALPKPLEPPVNTIEYYQMQMQKKNENPFTNIQQVAAPPHIQHTSTGFGTLRDQFQTGSYSENVYQTQNIHEHHNQQQQQTNIHGNTLPSLLNQYMNKKTQKSDENELPTQQVQNISQTIIAEDLPQQQKIQMSQQQQSQAPQLPQQQEQPTVPQVPQEQQLQAQEPTQKQQSQALQSSQQQEPQAPEPTQQQPQPSQPSQQQQQQSQAPEPAQQQQPTASEPTQQQPEALQPSEQQQPQVAEPAQKEEPQAAEPAEKEQPQAAEPAEKEQPQAAEPAEKEQPQTAEPNKKQQPKAPEPAKKQQPNKALQPTEKQQPKPLQSTKK